MLRPGLAFAALVSLACAAAAADEAPATIALGEIVGPDEQPLPDALPLAARLLAPSQAAVVVAGRLQRDWLPGQAFSATYREAPRSLGDRLCGMRVHAVSMRNASSAERPEDLRRLRLTIEPPRSAETIAVLPAWAAGECSAEQAYITRGEGLQGAFQEAAYRRLLEWMALARRGADPGVALECRSDQSADCTDARAALAALPLEALLGITVVNPREIVQPQQGGVRLITHPPLSEREPRRIEVSFGRSGRDGRSWRIGWIEAEGAAPRAQLRRTMITYH